MNGRFAEPTNANVDGENIGGSSKKRLTELLHLCFDLPVSARSKDGLALADGKSGLRAKVSGDSDRLDHVLNNCRLHRL